MKHSRKSQRKSYEEAGKEEKEDLKGEIRKLRKEVQQLRKENAKMRGRDTELQELLEEVRIEDVVIDRPVCPKCKSHQVKILEKLRNDKDYYFCENPDCQSRGPIK